MRPILPLLASLTLLPACSLFDNTDPRELDEPLEECLARFAELDAGLAEDTSNTQSSPTYTFDVTKLSLDELQDLSKPGSDDTAGQRLLRQTNETATAVELFMSEPVDEDGSFFLGRDPALYRVRGPEMWPKDAVRIGCAMQKPGMRLREVESVRDLIVEPEIDPALDPDHSDNETSN